MTDQCAAHPDRVAVYVCDGCRKLDQGYGDVTYTKEEIWSRPPHVSLTDRYVWSWNQLVREMRNRIPTPGSASISIPPTAIHPSVFGWKMENR